MPKTRLRWLLFGAFTILLAGLCGAFWWIAARTFSQFYYAETLHQLESKSRLVMRLAEPGLLSKNPEALEPFCRSLGGAAGARVTFILPDGRVLADSEEEPGRMENHADRPEIMGALAGKTGTAERYSYTLRQTMLYLALPYRAPGATRITAIVRLAIPTTAMSSSLQALYLRFALLTGLVLLFGAGLGWWMAQKISRPLEEMRKQAARFARGDLKQKISLSDWDEVHGLAKSLNDMASQWDQKTRDYLDQHQALQAILASMAEGVLAVDSQTRMLNANAAALALLQISGAQPVTGRPLAEVIRNSRLQAIVEQALAGTPAQAEELVLGQEEERHLQVHGSALRDAEGRQIGAVLVLNDTTRLHRLESLRREFVANVSHELKTPVTLIQGFIETLQEGALKKPAEAKRFLDIIARQSDRLHAIIEDLLALSRIEQDAERGAVDLIPAPLAPVLASSLALCQPMAASKKIQLTLDCPADLQVRQNGRLLEQAVVNYLNNAITYSEPGGTVAVAAARRETDIIITVSDQGCGIPAEHLPRLFERFYRVDKGRSREAGGSGLGLAIVKHIAQAHGGQVAVESAPGQGSTFSIILPGL